MSIERRKFPRADLNFDVHYFEEQNPAAHGGKNICAGGMAFRTSDLLPTGMNLRLVFKTPGNPNEIRARARVVRSWTEKGECIAAAEFYEIDAEDKSLLTKLVENYLKTSTVAI